MNAILLVLAFYFSIAAPNAETFYQCYDSDTNQNLKISVKFVNEKAVSVKYKGQKTAVPVVFKDKIFENGGAHPNITSIYLEKYNGKITGKYTFTHSGVWDYIEYQRNDGKRFKFTINLDLSTAGNGYRTSPCY